MFDDETTEAIAKAAAEYGLEGAALMAIAELETAGTAFASFAGRREPLIRFEGHYFDRRLGDEARTSARAEGLSSPTAGRIANPGGQAARWRMLDRAAAIDAKAAYESTSWGLGQVMGAHWAWLGYADVAALAAEARGSAVGQARLMARYIVKAGLADAIARRDWAAFARGYNGPGYARNRYDRKLAAAFARHAGASPAAAAAPLLKRGSQGAAVKELQEALTAAGYPIASDGTFGPATEAAVRRFQNDSGLRADGIVGPRTRAALAERSRNGFLARLMALILRFFGV